MYTKKQLTKKIDQKLKEINIKLKNESNRSYSFDCGYKTGLEVALIFIEGLKD